MSGEIKSAAYNSEREVVEWNGETESGEEVSGSFGRRCYGPETELQEKAMEQMAEKLPGTPIFNRTDGSVFDVTSVPASIGFGDESL